MKASLIMMLKYMVGNIEALLVHTGQRFIRFITFVSGKKGISAKGAPLIRQNAPARRWLYLAAINSSQGNSISFRMAFRRPFPRSSLLWKGTIVERPSGCLK